MKQNDNYYRTQNGGVHSISKNAKVDNLILDESRPRSAHKDRMYILHAGIINANKKK